MTDYFIGFDVGGTKTHALVVEASGRARGFGCSGPGNPKKVGYDGLAEALNLALDQAIVSAGISKAQIAGAGFGIAGFDWPSQREDFLRAIRSLELSAPLEVVNDVFIGLLAGTEKGWGIALVAGTNCNCRGWDQYRREGRVTGYGYSLGEAAGGSELVVKAMQAVASEWTRRGPPTRLTQAFIEAIGARDISDLLEGYTTNRYKLSAKLAPVVFHVASEGDPVAKEMIIWAGRELGSMAAGVALQLGFESSTFDVVLVGSLFDGSSLLIDTVDEVITSITPGARLTRLAAPPVIGGALLAMQQAGLETSNLCGLLLDTASQLLQQSKLAT